MISNKITTALFIIMVIFSCQKEHVNPYDNQDLPDDNIVDEVELDPISIEGLHANIFGKTCANSGCHDGNFQPDFRTVYSSYNTLVQHPVLLNDAQNTYTYRVEPNNAENITNVIIVLFFILRSPI